MTEAEWLACGDPAAMIRFASNATSFRKERLFAAACCRRVNYLLRDDCCGLIVRVERYADHMLSSTEVSGLLYDIGQFHPAQIDTPLEGASLYAVSAIYCAADCDNAIGAAHSAAMAVNVARLNPANFDSNLALSTYKYDPSELNAQSALIRDIFGNPFRPVAFDPAWRTSTAVALAQQMYESRDFSAMPVLADALQDAGCDSDDVLAHCRGDGPHVRGCWVLDAVLGKE